LLARAKAKTLPFDLPPAGSIAVELGAGLGWDSRNLASMAGYVLTSVDVSPNAIEQAKNMTAPEMLGQGAGKIEFVAYDAMALPVPKERIDFLFDATVYCGLRHEHLTRSYDLWDRLATPGHTLVNIQCMSQEYAHGATPTTQHDMEKDFEPVFDILQSERCVKNQGGEGWCFFMKLKAPEVRKRIAEERLGMQKAARAGDLEYVRTRIQDPSQSVSDDEIKTLYYIARTNKQASLVSYLRSMYPKKDDRFFAIIYGKDAQVPAVEAEDRIDGGNSKATNLEVQFLRSEWEREEAELILEARLNDLKEITHPTNIKY